jgi:hypothetical protein
MHVNVNFTLNIDPAEWATTSASTIRPDAPDAMERIADEVRAHAENVVRDLFADMGWTIEEVNA